ncbi:MAG: Ig-like domain-containing protein [Verrucomicrobiota bacterium]
MVNAGPPATIGLNAVVHLVSEDIYIDIKFTSWGGSAGGFAYQRSTEGSVFPTPIVSITHPIGGAVFSAPANLTLRSTAEVSTGTVTNVSFFGNGATLGSGQIAPYSITASNLPAGDYALTAVATANGISATSSVVSVRIISPIATILSSPQIANGQFSFYYSTDPGLTYLIQNSSNLVNWTPIFTNTATTNPARFTESSNPNGFRFYRVGRMTNP